MDGPPHRHLRKAFSDRFLPKGMKSLDGVMHRLVAGVLNRVLPKGECDFAVDVAGRLPLELISYIMNIPEGKFPDIYRWTYMSTSPDDPEFTIGTAEHTSRVGTVAMMDYCLELAKERRIKPGDDLISDIAVTRVDGEYLSDNVVAFNAISFVAAGHETTRNAMCGALAELAENDQAELQRMRGQTRDSLAMRRMAEESVRWSSPLTHQLRVAMDDCEIGGVAVAEGDWVVMWNNSANRDEDVFDQPYSFNGTRNPNPHLGFGSGPHFCLGSHLARLELSVMWEMILDYMHDIELTAVPEVTPSMILRGIKHMPIKFQPRDPIPLD